VRPDLHIDLGLCHPEPWFVYPLGFTLVPFLRPPRRGLDPGWISFPRSNRTFSKRGERRDLVPAEAFGLLPRAPNPSAAACRQRPILPGSLVTVLRLEGSVGDRSAGDSDRLASQGIQTVLEMEVSDWQTTTAGEYSPTDCSHGARESDLGRRAIGCGVVSKTSDSGLPANGSVLLAVAALSPRHQKDFVPKLEDICPQSRRVPRGM
jgi:hypothetical protein